MRPVRELRPPPGSLLSNTLEELPPTGLTLLVAPPASGKTGTLLKLAYRYALTLPTLFFTLDRTAEDLAARLYGAYPATEVSRRQLTFCDDRYTIEEMDHLADSGAYSLLMVDDLELITCRDDLIREEKWDRVWQFLERWSQDRPVFAAMGQRNGCKL